MIKQTKKPEPIKNPDFKWLGKYVKFKRTSLGLGIIEASNMCGLSKTAYSNIEHGENSTTESLFKVLFNLGIRISIIEQDEDFWN